MIVDMLNTTNEASVGLGVHGIPTLRMQDEIFGSTVREKLDLSHLFSRQVDQYLQSRGIVEFENERIKVSIPGELSDAGILRVGFFQYTFIPKDWILIHRCFVNYDSHAADNLFVSKVLRRVLYDFLANTKQNETGYSSVISDLAGLCGDK